MGRAPRLLFRRGQERGHGDRLPGAPEAHTLPSDAAKLARPKAMATVERQIEPAACPACRTPGELGKPCQSRRCGAAGWHCVPAQAAWWPSRQGDSVATGRLVSHQIAFHRLLLRKTFAVHAGIDEDAKQATELWRLQRPALQQESADTAYTRIKAQVDRLLVVQHRTLARAQWVGIGRDGLPFVLYEVQGRAKLLAEWLGEATPHVDRNARAALQRVVGDIALGLTALHKRGLVHGSLCQDTVRVCGTQGDVQAQLVGQGMLGVMPVRNGRANPLPAATIAPECWWGAPVSRKSDVYALGVLLLELVVGEAVPPYLQPTLGQATCDLTRAVDGLAGALEILLQQMLHRRVDRRLTDVAALRRQMDDAIEVQFAPGGRRPCWRQQEAAQTELPDSMPVPSNAGARLRLVPQQPEAERTDPSPAPSPGLAVQSRPRRLSPSQPGRIDLGDPPMPPATPVAVLVMAALFAVGGALAGVWLVLAPFVHRAGP